MDVRLFLLFFIACIVVLNGTIIAQMKCKLGQWDDLLEVDGDPYELPPLYLPPNIPDIEVEVPIPVECYYKRVTRLDVVACDHDFKPRINFKTKFLPFVERTGSSQGEGTVLRTVWCS